MANERFDLEVSRRPTTQELAGQLQYTRDQIRKESGFWDRHGDDQEEHSTRLRMGSRKRATTPKGGNKDDRTLTLGERVVVRQSIIILRSHALTENNKDGSFAFSTTGKPSGMERGTKEVPHNTKTGSEGKTLPSTAHGEKVAGEELDKLYFPGLVDGAGRPWSSQTAGASSDFSHRPPPFLHANLNQPGSHSKSATYRCNTCGKAFRAGSDLRQQERNLYVGEEKVSDCPTCKARFMWKKDLTRHEQSESHRRRTKEHRPDRLNLDRVSSTCLCLVRGLYTCARGAPNLQLWEPRLNNLYHTLRLWRDDVVVVRQGVYTECSSRPVLLAMKLVSDLQAIAERKSDPRL